MRIVLLEDLGISPAALEKHLEPLIRMGHTVQAYPRDTDPLVQAERCRDADVLILANMPLAEAALAGAEHLQFIDVAFTGVDHLPMAEIKRRGIAVSNASGYATQAVAELCLSFMIQLLRNLGAAEARCRRGETKTGFPSRLLAGKTVGIVGAGAIGRRVAALCKAFGCRVIAYSRSPVDDNAIDRQVPLAQLLSQADIVTLHCPLTTETAGLIGSAELAQMQPSAVLINTARGGVVDTRALAQALEAGTIAGAACDVFDVEPPLPLDYPLLHTPNTIVTPHLAFSSPESMVLRAEIVFANLHAWLSGQQSNAV